MLAGRAIVAARRNVPISIDFGTHGSGFMHSIGGNSERILECFTYPDQPNPCVKTLTAILYKDGEPVAWGWTAQKTYVQLSARDMTLHDYIFLKGEDFKLALNVSSGRTMPHGMDAVRVTADYLKFLADFALEKTRQNHGRAFHADLVQWCLTVPANWDDSTKDKMREAARLAGIIKDADALVMVYEPEAGALAAKASLADSMAMIQPGDVFMVMDAGGGTVDVTMHRAVRRNGQIVLAETTYRKGVFAGSCFVDENFRNYFKQEVGQDAYEEWRQNYPLEGALLDAEWELKKHHFGASTAPPAHVNLPDSLLDLMKEGDKDALRCSNEGDYDDRVTLDSETMESFFDPVITQVIDLLSEQLQADTARRCDKLLLVGGFAESPYLQQCIREALHNRVPTVLVPPHPQKAILQGAVLFGCNPDLIFARCSRLTYGIRIATEYEEGAPTKFWVPEEGCYFTDAAFCPFVRRGQQIQVDEVVEHVVRPLHANQRLCDVDLFATEATERKFIPPDLQPGRQVGGMVQIGSLQVQLPEDMGDHHVHNIMVRLQFGRAEITATAHDLQTGEERNVRLMFAHQRVPL